MEATANGMYGVISSNLHNLCTTFILIYAFFVAKAFLSLAFKVGERVMGKLLHRCCRFQPCIIKCNNGHVFLYHIYIYIYHICIEYFEGHGKAPVSS